MNRMSRSHPTATNRGRDARRYIDREYGDQLVRMHGQSFLNAA